MGELMASFDWGAILGILALAVTGFLAKLHKNLGNALNKLTDAVAGESEKGSAISKEEWQDIKAAAMGKK